MKKARSDAKWNGLSGEQQKLLEHWLFEEKLGYDAALERAKTELGFTGSKASLQRFYKFVAQGRFMAELAEAGLEATEAEASPAHEWLMAKSGMKALAQRFYRQMRDEGITDMPTVAKLLLKSQANRIKEASLEIRFAMYDLQFERLQLSRERLELQRGRKSSRATDAQEEDPYSYNRRTNALRKKMFGCENLPDLLPESAEEEAAMKAADEEKEARLKPEQDAAQAEFEKGRAKFYASMGMEPPPALKPQAFPPEPKETERAPESEKREGGGDNSDNFG